MALSPVIPSEKVATVVAPLSPVIDPDTGSPAILKVAGVTLAVAGRDHSKPADFVLARHRPARAATADYKPATGKPGDPGFKPAVGKPARDEGWSPTSRTADIARAITGGLIDVADLIPQRAAA